MKVERAFVDSIDVGERMRPLNEGAVQRLVESMKALGQLQPISVFAPSPDSITLVAGRHRLEAARRLEWDEIDAVFVTGDEIDRQMQEIAENLHRVDLTALERDEQVARWVELVESKVSQLATPSGGVQPKERGVRKASRELGISKDQISRAVKVASIAPEAKQAARDAGLDNNHSALLAASREDCTEAQVAKISEIAQSKINKSKSVKLADAPLNDFETTEKQVAALMAAWNKAGREARERFLATIDKPIMDRRFA